MAIVVLCPGCSIRLTLGDDRAGTTLNCPNCDKAISVAAPVSTPKVVDYSPPKIRKKKVPPLPVPIKRRRRGGSKIGLFLLIAGILIAVAGLVLSSHYRTEMFQLKHDSPYGSLPPEYYPQELRERMFECLKLTFLALTCGVVAWQVAMLGLCIYLAGQGRMATDGCQVGRTHIGGLVAVPISQYMPFTGGFIEKPSQCRPGVRHDWERLVYIW